MVRVIEKRKDNLSLKNNYDIVTKMLANLVKSLDKKAQ
jgi:hypothetical protein